MSQDELVQPIITPRFAISCDDMLMKGLAEIAQKYQLNIQVSSNRPFIMLYIYTLMNIC